MRIGVKAKSNDTERILRALPEVITVNGINYILRIGKTGDSTGKLSRYYVSYTSSADGVLCHYEESTLAEAANQAFGKIMGFKS